MVTKKSDHRSSSLAHRGGPVAWAAFLQVILQCACGKVL